MMKRQILCSLLAAACCAAGIASAQSRPEGFPTKPIRIYTGTAAGGAPDILARSLSQKLTERWNTAVIVDNQAGGAGIPAVLKTAQATPDGHTMLLSSGATELLAVFKRIDLNTLLPVVGMTSQPYLLVVTNSLPVKAVKELVAYAKAHPRELNFASAGNGSLPHLTQEMFNTAVGVEMTHIPYKGSGSVLPDLMKGRVHVFFISTISGTPPARAGSIRAIAVSSPQRLAGMPDLPTVAESGVPGFEMNNGYGLLTAANAPMAAVNAINREVIQIIHQPDFREKLAADGAEPLPPHTPAQYRDQINNRFSRLSAVVEKVGIKQE